MSNLFRREALDNLSNLNQLDQALKVTSPLGWVALSTAAAIIVGCTAWSIFGTYRVTVSGPGLLVRENGAFVNIYAPKSGWLESFSDRGDVVKEGELIARLSSPEEEERLADASSRVEQLNQQRADVIARFGERLVNEQRVAQRKREALEEVINLGQSRVRELQALLDAREGLQARGLITSERILEVRERMFAARESISQARADLLSLDASLLALQSQHAQELEALERQLRDSVGQRTQIGVSQELATSIRSRVAGTVVLDEVSGFALVSAGQRLLVIETGDDRLQALLYVPAEAGKQVHPGMEVRISPSVAKKEEYGSLIGTVVKVDPVPETETALAERLSNRDLARQFSRMGPPLQVEIRLEKGPDGPQSYGWTSRRGQEVELSSGTLLEGQVTVRTGRPIALVIPAIRHWLGL
ncbi:MULTISPECIES: NHLP bacteriocin system secretion protein [unclassified Chelatococcus]|uniref:NHLP bacteriocin system secretion protein n=1 Tax=unclassified Chelatococcus TaxID=2638111 RepID=UPI001BD08A16|nr:MULTISPECIES: NHLP bacteriocin system secretion protein [unclassified Chelatococcus]CAH1655580.1 NHLP bacteriocin system secretion protein [Hyphomicrobiales bacterium]MBS7742589.1 NHLP bacteriocin system secretion protein [Chelatococcus sp. HY11]MBX3542293.1 NHLP bacteriocin system secretion protein [Chelatococcus sp.]MCO5075489.1 NHLP bacteriocin system secretion protein [Chelatococcus sp.]CAH1695553.1 NHLP bacteriocin system secretion protein [Hyphomicrobiales bacterium]